VANTEDSLHGINCPKCGGVVPIPEGQVIVKCPYCDLRSLVRGERGVLRYQTPARYQREHAIQALNKFLSSSMAIARGARRQAQLSEAFLVYLPFWTVWGRVAAWAFGQKKVGSGDDAHYEPREIRIVQDMTWNGAACDVGEFGVSQIQLAEGDLQPFDAEKLHQSGMVFEPVGSSSDARQSAESRFDEQVRSKARLDRLAQLFTRTVRKRFALVYHPLWMLRYLYRGRAFQVVVDGYSGQTLYGKAPGNTLYRAAILVLGMAFGAFIAIDIPGIILSASDGDDGIGIAIALFLAGIGGMLFAYRKFRHGEQYEYRRGGGAKVPQLDIPLDMISNVKEIEQWINRLS